MVMTKFKGIFLYEPYNGKKFEVNSSHVPQCSIYTAITAGAGCISFYSHTLYSLAYPLTSHDNSGVEGEYFSSSFIRDLIYEL
jgi:hypothetical protein